MSTYSQYTGNGIQTTFPIPFPYQKPAHVVLTVDGEPVTVVFIDAATVSIVPAPAEGSKVVLRRVTPSATPAVDFDNGNPRTGEDLNNAFNQALYVATEASDIATEALLGRDTIVAAAVDFQAGLSQLEAAQDVANGIISQAEAYRDEAGDSALAAATSASQALSSRNQASTFANAAASSAASIEGAAATAASQATAANNAAGTASLHKDAAAASAVAAANSAANATSQASVASGHKDTALTYRNEAQAARTAAQAAQALAEAAAENAQAAAASEGTVKASNTDSTVGTLMSKIVVSGAITKTLQNEGGNESVLLTVTATGGGEEGAATAAELPFTPVGNIASGNVQDAIEELDAEKASIGHTHEAQTALQTPFTPAGNLAATNVQAALAELDTEKAGVGHTHAAQTAGNTPFTPTGNLSAADVQAALEELDAEKQTLNALLSALSVLASSGLIARTSAGGVAARTLTAGSTKVNVTNGNGVSGNPTVDVDEANLTLGNIGGTLPVSKGGTGSTDAATARTALGITPANIGALGDTATAADSTKWGGATKYVSTAAPSGGADGDVWFEREA